MQMRRFFLIAIVCFSLLLSACQAQEPPRHRVEMQLAWGATVYRLECARCHDRGRSAPVLRAENLIPHRNAHHLFEFNRELMPLDNPGGLPDPYYWDVTAYILAAEGMLDLSGEKVLGPETAEAVDFLPD